MTRFLLFLATISLAFAAGSTVALACSYVAKPTCGTARFGNADFVGEVLSGKLVDADFQTENGVDSRLTRAHQVLVEVRVIESFRGPQKAGQIVHLRTGLGGGDCGYPFKVGGKFLIDATERNGTLYTGICALTAPVEDSVLEIESLRKLSAGLRVPDVIGVLYKVDTVSEDPHKKPLSGIGVSLTANSGRTSFRAFTNALGQFAFPQLPGGAYSISLAVPHNLSPVFTDFGVTTDQDEIPSLVVPSNSYDGAACHVEIYVDSAASISGTVNTSGNGPIDGWVNADNVKPDGTPWNTIRTSTPAPNGDFRLSHLPPGRYQIQFTARVGFVKGEPQIIDLKEGERKSGMILIAK